MLQFSGVARYQMIGEPQEDSLFCPALLRLDASVEAGASGTVYYNETARDVHLGINISLSGLRAVPYVSFRRHWGIYGFYGYSSRGPDEQPFVHDMLYLGLFFAGNGWGRPDIAVELFYGRTPGSEAGSTDVDWLNAGLNVIVEEKWW